MTFLWIIAAIIVLMAFSAVWKVLTRFVFAFCAAAAVMLAIHFQQDPGEASVALAGLGGALMLRRPLMRMVTRFI